MKVRFAIAAVVLVVSPAAIAAPGITASMDEANFATHMSTQVGLFEICGQQAALGAIPANLKAFEQSPYGTFGKPLASDMGMMTALDTATIIGKAGGKANFCAGLARIKPTAVKGVQDTWAALQKAHLAAKTTGH